MSHLRNIRNSDWRSISEIEAGSYIDMTSESLASLISRWELSPDSCFVVEKNSSVIGYLLSHPWYDNDVPLLNVPIDHLPETDLLYIHDVAVSENFRRMGAADLLVKRTIAYGAERNLNLIALVAVQGSHIFWEKYGFDTAKYFCSLNDYGGRARYMKKKLRHPPGPARQ